MKPIPLVGLGTWQLRGEECKKTIELAWDLGYRHIDTADMYQNHQVIGQAIKPYPRGELFLTTKIGMEELLPQQVDRAVPRFLKELGTDYVDLLLIHWPNDKVDMAKTLETMMKWKEKGAAKAIGVSNFVRSHLEALVPFRFPIATNQIEMHPYLQRRLLVACCKKFGIGVTAYRPLAKGAFEQDPVLKAIGASHGKSASQTALRWLVQQGIPVIPKAANPKHLAANLEIFDFHLSHAEMEQIAELDRNQRFCAPDGMPVLED